MSTKLVRGSKVFINPDARESWGVRVFDPDWATVCRQRDIESGNTMDCAGEPRLYSDVRMYDPGIDGDDLVTVTEVRGKASYLTVRGVYHAPTSLTKGVTSSGKICWFRSTDVVAAV
ncbi:MAG: hypothetical protein EBT79_07580 [Actinobacteria bacterium]|nr:hypothetical protein [Actinomycetota bacterium]NBR67120.1 hypothetical protein [Actinomycetota bacterium]